jgi:hypothetical protein
MQEAAPVLENVDAGAKQLAIKGLRGVVHQAVFHTALEHDHHPHTTLRRIVQGTPEAPPRQEVGVGQQDVVLVRRRWPARYASSMSRR